MDTTKMFEEIKQDRRQFIGYAAKGIAAAGALNVFPVKSGAASRDGRRRSARSMSVFPSMRRSSTCAAALRQRAGRIVRPSQISHKACSSRQMKQLVSTGASGYDWRKAEARLNALPQFITEIDGVDIHFIHVRSKHRQCVAADHHSRLAGLGVRAAEDHRSADRSDRPWRPVHRTRSTW